jgi:hypothetical protein
VQIINTNPQPYKKGETKWQKERRLALRDRHRETTCTGCHYNFYNYPKLADAASIEIPDDYSCWYLNRIKRGKCPLKSGY